MWESGHLVLKPSWGKDKGSSEDITPEAEKVEMLRNRILGSGIVILICFHPNWVSSPQDKSLDLPPLSQTAQDHSQATGNKETPSSKLT